MIPLILKRGLCLSPLIDKKPANPAGIELLMRLIPHLVTTDSCTKKQMLDMVFNIWQS